MFQLLSLGFIYADVLLFYSEMDEATGKMPRVIQYVKDGPLPVINGVVTPIGRDLTNPTCPFIRPRITGIQAHLVGQVIQYCKVPELPKTGITSDKLTITLGGM